LGLTDADGHLKNPVHLVHPVQKLGLFCHPEKFPEREVKMRFFCTEKTAFLVVNPTPFRLS
jgi:hypothetical protein